MNELQVFDSTEFGQLRTFVIDGNPWAVGKDIAAALGYDKPRNAIASHVDAEDKMGPRNGAPSVTDSMGRLQYPVWINESGMYALILSSKLPSAKRFKRWITSEVLPALRKTGSYTAKPAEQRELTRDDYLRAASIVGSCRNERLPIVLKLLENGGLNVPKIEELIRDPSIPTVNAMTRDTKGETAQFIELAIKDYGMTMRGIARITGLQTVQISRIRKGESKPTNARAKHICEAIKAEIAARDAAS